MLSLKLWRVVTATFLCSVCPLFSSTFIGRETAMGEHRGTRCLLGNGRGGKPLAMH